MSRRAKNKADHQADTRGGGWVGIPQCVMRSAAYVDLSLWARVVLKELCLQFNGFNNGSIVCTFDHLARRLGNSNRRAMSKAFAELMEHGLIDVTSDADWKGRKGREYRLTFVNTTPGGKFKAATNDYKDWVKPKPKASKTSSPKKPIFGDHVSLARSKNGDTSSPIEETEPEEVAEISHSADDRAGNTALPLIDSHTKCSFWWACEQELALERLQYGLVILCHDVSDQKIAY
ncbi:hypothetical protein [Erythrobacter ani]|uniref:Helix-turn-helix domain-containing protein n=1 Tax=Erythrobacter ani TaxID=2827235 RepID=A0ABS6SLQ3_9SPHN|nr:hypothetical protein [Erythrobacter ani]MBV7265902.1 hypothetical protein [Erythrobacter ani]